MVDLALFLLRKRFLSTANTQRSAWTSACAGLAKNGTSEDADTASYPDRDLS